MPSLPVNKPDTRSLPRILCLHGGGVNATIFEVQSRALVPHLQQSFRLVWADAPFFCDPHTDIIDVYGSYAPFRRWLRWLPGHPKIDSETCIEEIGYAIRTAMEDDDRAGGTGEWVGLMGFSQGAKLSASLLVEQQAREAVAQREQKEIQPGFIGLPGINWRFGILLAGGAPITNFSPELLKSRALVDAGDIFYGFDFGKTIDDEAMVHKPTLHVHGLADPGLLLHRKLFEQYSKDGTKTLLEWGGAHRIPIKKIDVEPLIKAIYDLAERTGVPVKRTV